MAVTPGSDLYVVATIDYAEKQFFIRPEVYRTEEHAEAAFPSGDQEDGRYHNRIFKVTLETQ